MRLLITGAGGLLGLNIALDALRSHSVFGVDRGSLRGAPFTLLTMDLLEPGAFDRALSQSRAEVVIHCAALANVDACESDPDGALRVNAELPTRIAETCRRSGVQLLHISTDAVFDGTSSAAYSEDDQPNPTSVYAQTKYAGEAAVLSADPEAIVARVNFYGWSSTGRRSLAEFFVANLSAGTAVRGFDDVIFCPMLVHALGRLLLRMLDARLRGLFHVVGQQPMSKYDFGMAIAHEFDLNSDLITRTSVESAGLAARRAHNLCLSVHKVSTALGGNYPEFSTGLTEFHRQFAAGYPQQIRSYQQLSTASLEGGSNRGRASGTPTK